MNLLTKCNAFIYNNITNIIMFIIYKNIEDEYY
jgi:hypothetical protein